MQGKGNFLSLPGQRFASECPPPILGRPLEIPKECRKTISLSETNEYQREPSTRVPLVWKDIAIGPIRPRYARRIRINSIDHAVAVESGICDARPRAFGALDTPFPGVLY
jgi:hypothetical protein